MGIGARPCARFRLNPATLSAPAQADGTLISNEGGRRPALSPFAAPYGGVAKRPTVSLPTAGRSRLPGSLAPAQSVVGRSRTPAWGSRPRRPTVVQTTTVAASGIMGGMVFTTVDTLRERIRQALADQAGPMTAAALAERLLPADLESARRQTHRALAQLEAAGHVVRRHGRWASR